MMVQLYIKMNKTNEAFEYVERSNSRAFLDIMASSNLYLEPTSEMTNELRHLINKERYYRLRLNEIQFRHLSPTVIEIKPGET